MKRVYGTIICMAFLIGISCKRNNPEDILQEKQTEVKNLVSFLNAHPDSTGLRLIVANKMDSTGEYKNALLHIDTLIKNDSTRYGLWMAKANILQDSGNINEAKYYFRKAIAIYPGNEALMGLSEILANEKNDSCLAIAKQFNEQSDTYADYISALYFYNANNTVKADSLIDKCILHNRDFIKPYLLKGNILLQKKRLKDALHIFEEGLDTEPKNTALLNAAANAYEQLKMPDSAKAYFNKSLMAKPFQPQITEKLKSFK